MTVQKQFSVTTPINASQYDYVLAFFMSVTNSKELSEKYTGYVLASVNQNGGSIQSVLKSMVTESGKINMSPELAYYLNNVSNTKTKMYGIYSPLNPLMSVYRNIIP